MKCPVFHVALAAIANLSALSVAIAAHPVQAIEPDYPCYFKTATGAIINLTQSVCQQKVQNDLRTDQAFLNEYRRLNAQNDIGLSLAAGDPQLLIQAAHHYCSGQPTGNNSADPEISVTVERAIAAVNNLAQKYYCPPLAQRS
ncbi:MAG: hypothetical protein KME16_09265 [Scytolyngbya sp. HA4215-MV1]|jgi:hypothetical protein|nr:hypothetical protein [Scytolyngbya sp. HA4215-MV1]